MKIKKFSKREKLILFAVCLIIICLLVSKFLLAPIIGQLIKINHDIDTKVALLKRHFSLVYKGENIFSHYENYKNDLGKGTPSGELMATLFKEMEDSARKFNLIIEKIKPQPVEKKEGYSEVSIEVELVGDFIPIFQFINHLENLPSFTKISSLRLLPQSRTSSDLRCQLSLTKLFF